MSEILEDEIGEDVQSIKSVDEETIVIETGLDGWNEYFVKEICRVMVDNSSGKFGVSFDEDVDGFDGFTATIREGSNNPRMYILLFGKYIGLSPSVISSCLEDAKEESERPVDDAIDTILEVSIDTGKAISEKSLRDELL